MSTSGRPSAAKASKVRTIMDELLYETLKSSVDQADQANQNRNALPPTAIPTTDQLKLLKVEMQHSAVAIVSAVTCLDTYVNSIFEDKVQSPELRQSVKNMGPVQKWYNAPSILGVSGRFDFDLPPMSDFRRIVGHRHKYIIHRETIYSDSNSKYILPDYQYINVANAQLALATAKSMIKTLCGFLGTAIPKWL